MIGKTLAAAGAGIAAAFASALCCAGPLLAVMAGVSGAGLASTFEPMRPYFLGAAVLAVGSGHALLHREERKACEPGRPCAAPATRRTMKWMVWSATALALVFAAFPWWSGWILS